MAETTDGAVLAAGLEAENTEGLGNDHLLHLVVGRGDTLEDLQSLHRRGTTSSLVGDHASDGLVEDTGGGSEVEGTYLELEKPFLRYLVESWIEDPRWRKRATYHLGWGCTGSSCEGRRGT